MLDRYTIPETVTLLGQRHRGQLYLRILAWVARIQGHGPTGAALDTLDTDLAGWRRAEAHYRHETAGFVAWVREALPEHRSNIYVGMTSSDLQDTADALVWQSYLAQLLGPAVRHLMEHWANTDPTTIMLREARTHGRGTQLMVPVDRLYLRAASDLNETLTRINQIPLRANLSGPVGGYSEYLPINRAMEVAAALSLQIDFQSTQTADRHRMAELAMQLVQLIGCVEQVATVHRLASISGVDEYSEGHANAWQKGSSAMPHKVNPISAEQVCGLARIARGLLTPILETAHTQWWERDLTNSSVERVAWHDLLHLTLYIVLAAHDWATVDAWTPQPADGDGYSSFHRYNDALTIGQDPEAAYQAVKNNE